ncbi:MAG: hypothetical protein V7711_03350 [Pseudomonadales bacterium]
MMLPKIAFAGIAAVVSSGLLATPMMDISIGDDVYQGVHVVDGHADARRRDALASGTGRMSNYGEIAQVGSTFVASVEPHTRGRYQVKLDTSRTVMTQDMETLEPKLRTCKSVQTVYLKMDGEAFESSGRCKIRVRLYDQILSADSPEQSFPEEPFSRITQTDSASELGFQADYLRSFFDLSLD